MTLQCVLPMSVFGGADAETFCVNLTTEQAENLIANMGDALDKIYDLEDAAPFELFRPSNN